MQKRGLEGLLWNDYSRLTAALSRHGYRPKAWINRFAVYQLGTPDSVSGGLGTYFAVRESRLDPNEIEKALFWTAGSLEEAVFALSYTPVKTAGESAKDDVLRPGSLFLTAALGAVTAFLSENAGAALGVAGLCVAGRAALSLMRNYVQWQEVTGKLGNCVEGKAALARVVEFTEMPYYYPA